MLASEALERILKSYVRYYDINRDTPLEPFAAEAEFHSLEKGYILSKKAVISESESNEYIFFHTSEKLNADDSVSGILCQLPLPQHIDEEAVIEAISSCKDVDGFSRASVGALSIGSKGFVSCTPAGVIELIKRSGIEIAGKDCVVIGRSNIVGKPMGQLLQDANCTVTICHSKTQNIEKETSTADILVAALGKAKGSIRFSSLLL